MPRRPPWFCCIEISHEAPAKNRPTSYRGLQSHTKGTMSAATRTATSENCFFCFCSICPISATSITLSRKKACALDPFPFRRNLLSAPPRTPHHDEQPCNRFAERFISASVPFPWPSASADVLFPPPSFPWPLLSAFATRPSFLPLFFVPFIRQSPASFFQDSPHVPSGLVFHSSWLWRAAEGSPGQMIFPPPGTTRRSTAGSIGMGEPVPPPRVHMVKRSRF